MIRLFAFIMDVIARNQQGRHPGNLLAGIAKFYRYVSSLKHDSGLRHAGMTTRARNDIAFIMALIVLINVSAPQSAFASFDDFGVGGRATGMADAFTAVADNADALWYNPAGLVNVKDGMISTEYSKFLQSLDDGSSLNTTYIGYAHPLRGGQKGVLGIGYHNFQGANLLSERTILLSYGWKLRAQPMGWMGLWSAGFALKQLHRQYEPDRFTENALNDAGVGSGQSDPLFSKNGYGNDAYSLDTGALYQFGPREKYSLGVVLKNINQPDVSLGGDGDKPPLVAKIGGAIRQKWGLISAELRRTKRLESAADTDMAVGLERKFLLAGDNAFMLRGGYASGSRNYKAVTAGASYQLGRAEMDYAFNFPVGNLNALGGSHRVGLSFKLGGALSQEDIKRVEPEIDLLAAFVLDSMAAHEILKRAFETERVPAYKRMLFLQLLMKKYPSSDAGLLDIGQDLSRYIDDPRQQLLSWPDIKLQLFLNFDEENRLAAEDAFENVRMNQATGALARLGLVSGAARNTIELRALTLIPLAELAAQAYRAKNIDGALEKMRQIMDIVPSDPMIMKAYRKLLLMRMSPQATQPVQADQMTVTPALPDAPATLVAPTPVTGVGTQIRNTADFDVMVKNFGTLLGYYLTRKQAGASNEERRVLLNQLKALFEGSGIDMTLVNMELETLPGTTNVAPVVKPVAKPTPKPAPKTTPKPAPTINPELEKSWLYYQEAVKRGISDHERIELLENMLLRYGEATAPKVSQELERIRRRVE